MPSSTYSYKTRAPQPLKPLKKKVVTPTWKCPVAPTGWTLAIAPTKTSTGRISIASLSETTSENLQEKYKALKLWADKASLELAPYDFALIRYNTWSETYIWYAFTATVKSKPKNDNLFGSFKCPECSTTLSSGLAYCPNCTYFLHCAACNVPGLRLHGVTGRTKLYCARCAVPCTKKACGNLVAPGDTITECTECSPRESCTVCKVVFRTSDLKEHAYNKAKFSLCKNCAATHICETCGVPGLDVSAKTIGKLSKTLCDKCVQTAYEKERKKFEAWPATDLPVSGTMEVPVTPQRPIRTISIEIEFDGKGPDVAKALYRAGLIASPNKQNYSAMQDEGKRLPCILKSDSSVSGGELVAYLLDMDNKNHAAALLRTCEVMRGCQQLNHVQLTSRAGGHIHIDMHGYGLEDLWSYYTIFKYLETPLYHLAGSGHDYGHRTEKGSGYSSPPRGGPFGTKEAFAAGLRSMGRAGLNIGNYNGAIHNCVCGAAVTGNWKQCSCNLGKATAEWRLWNAQINPKILHAYIAIMQATTAFAYDNVCAEADFAYMPWQVSKAKTISDSDKVKINERLTWMFTYLPLTEAEKDSIVYTAKKSRLSQLGTGFLDGLMDVTSITGSNKEKTRNPNSRASTKFALTEQDMSAAPAPSRRQRFSYDW